DERALHVVGDGLPPLVHVGDHHGRALGRQRPRVGLPDALRPTGHDRDLALEPHVCLPKCLPRPSGRSMAPPSLVALVARSSLPPLLSPGAAAPCGPLTGASRGSPGAAVAVMW